MNKGQRKKMRKNNPLHRKVNSAVKYDTTIVGGRPMATIVSPATLATAILIKSMGKRRIF